MGNNPALYPSGKGQVCKTFIHRFDSDQRLYLSIKTDNFFQNTAQVVELGRHKGLKIPWTFSPCGFNSRPGQF